MALWKKMAYPHSPKKGNYDPQYRRYLRNLKYYQLLATKYQKKDLSPHKKKDLWVGGVYTIENNDANVDHHKFVRVGDQEWEFVEITTGITFFLFSLRFAFIIFYTGSFHVPPKKNFPHLKFQLNPKSQLDVSFSYINVLKNGSSPGSPRKGCKLWEGSS